MIRHAEHTSSNAIIVLLVEKDSLGVGPSGQFDAVYLLRVSVYTVASDEYFQFWRTLK